MRANDDILDLLREKGAEVAWKAQRGVILQPGAIGDCILTLPLAAFMKDVLGLGSVDILGHSDLGIVNMSAFYQAEPALMALAPSIQKIYIDCLWKRRHLTLRTGTP